MSWARHLVIAMGLAVLPRTGIADIYQWVDADGVRHYTNLLGAVPSAKRDSMQVVVDEQARRLPAESGVAATSDPALEPAPAPEPAAMANRVAVCEAYVAGLVRGFEVAEAVGTAPAETVEINAPLAVARVTNPPLPPWVVDGPYEPLVTTAFDRGRSRHLTLRMLLQEQFAIDRGAPFVYPERFLPPYRHAPVGVGLNPFLPRGLPHGAPRHTRVVVR